jgi:hypothetical protein
MTDGIYFSLKKYEFIDFSFSKYDIPSQSKSKKMAEKSSYIWALACVSDS